MILDTTTKSIQVVLATNVATTQAQVFASYADLTATTFVPGSADLPTNNTTAVTAVSAPPASTQRQIKNLQVYNADTSNITVSVQLLDGATTRVLYKATLVPGQTLEWQIETGWKTPSLLTANTPDFISGLRMSYTSASSITVSAGEAWVPGSNALAQLTSPVTITGIALGASAMGHVYINAAGQAQAVATAPSATYAGTARTKTGDTTWRYVGSIISDASGNVVPFVHTNNAVFYNFNIDDSRLKVLSSGTATTATNVSCASCVPVSSALVLAFLYNSVTNSATVVFSNSAGPTLPGAYLGFVAALQGYPAQAVLDSSQQFNYAYQSAPSGGGFFVRVTGYVYDR